MLYIFGSQKILFVLILGFIILFIGMAPLKYIKSDHRDMIVDIYTNVFLVNFVLLIVSLACCLFVTFNPRPVF